MDTFAVPVIDPERIESLLSGRTITEVPRFREVISRGLEMKGLSPEDVACLASVSDPGLLQELYDAAKKVKETIYGKRLVIFAPMYISNLCGNECLYCAFRASNPGIVRRALTQEEIARETAILVDQGHKRVLLVAGESYPREGFGYVLKSIATVYGVKSGRGEIRRINVNVAPLTSTEFSELKTTGIGHVPALPGNVPSRGLRQGAHRRKEKGLRLADHSDRQGDGGRYRRRRDRGALRSQPLGVGVAGPASAHPAP